MKRKTIVSLIAVIILLAGTAAATYFITANSLKKAGTTTSVTKKTNAKNGKSTPSDENGTNPSDNGNTVDLTLYFSDSQAQYLVAEKRTVAKQDDIYRTAVEELIKGPKDSAHAPTVPDKMILVNISVENGTATVDFGKAMNTLAPRGTAGEKMFIYSIVDTLTGFSGIQKVKFLAGGSTPEISSSRVDWASVFARDETVIHN